MYLQKILLNNYFEHIIYPLYVYQIIQNNNAGIIIIIK